MAVRHRQCYDPEIPVNIVDLMPVQDENRAAMGGRLKCDVSAMSRPSNAGSRLGWSRRLSTASIFHMRTADKDYSVSFLDVVSFLNELHILRAQGAGGFGICRLGTEDPAIWDDRAPGEARRGDRRRAAVRDRSRLARPIRHRPRYDLVQA